MQVQVVDCNQLQEAVALADSSLVTFIFKDSIDV
jgi:hypothetical protein